MDARPVLLVGSVAASDAEDVFRKAGRRIGSLLRSLPDGETGARAAWVAWQSHRFLEVEGLTRTRTIEFVPGLEVYFFRPVDGRTLDEVELGELGYAAAAAGSYPIFRAMRDRGELPADLRFQISMPTPLAMTWFFDDGLDALGLLERAMRDEVERITAVVPAEDLAIQWDLAIETEAEEALRQGADYLLPPPPLARSIASCAALCDMIPTEVALGLHLCYGDPDGEHVLQPRDSAVMTDLAGGLLRATSRRVDWLHMPVPKDRHDDAYFAPLDGLDLPAGTTLYLGLIHLADGVEGARSRAGAAAAHLNRFGVATECGLGRRAPSDIPALLDLHDAVARAV